LVELAFFVRASIVFLMTDNGPSTWSINRYKGI
jgi:hypothetical protein